MRRLPEEHSPIRIYVFFNNSHLKKQCRFDSDAADNGTITTPFRHFLPCATLSDFHCSSLFSSCQYVFRNIILKEYIFHSQASHSQPLPAARSQKRLFPISIQFPRVLSRLSCAPKGLCPRASGDRGQSRMIICPVKQASDSLANRTLSLCDPDPGRTGRLRQTGMHQKGTTACAAGKASGQTSLLSCIF